MHLSSLINTIELYHKKYVTRNIFYFIKIKAPLDLYVVKQSQVMFHKKNEYFISNVDSSEPIHFFKPCKQMSINETTAHQNH
jgi:hypothetical protein